MAVKLKEARKNGAKNGERVSFRVHENTHGRTQGSRKCCRLHYRQWLDEGARNRWGKKKRKIDRPERAFWPFLMPPHIHTHENLKKKNRRTSSPSLFSCCVESIELHIDVTSSNGIPDKTLDQKGEPKVTNCVVLMQQKNYLYFFCVACQTMQHKRRISAAK